MGIDRENMSLIKYIQHQELELEGHGAMPIGKSFQMQNYQLNTNLKKS